MKLAATVGGNVRRTEYLENSSSYKMRDTGRKRCQVSDNKSKCKALAKRTAVDVGLTSESSWRGGKRWFDKYLMNYYNLHGMYICETDFQFLEWSMQAIFSMHMY